MPDQFSDAQKSATTENLANDWLLLGAAVTGLSSLLAVPSQEFATKLAVFAVEAVSAVAFIGYGSFLRWRGVNSKRYRPFFFAASFVVGFALVALSQVPGLQSVKPSASVPSTVESIQGVSALSGFVYVDAGDIEPRYASSLIQALREKRWQVIDDPARSAVSLHVSVDVAVSPGLSVGSTATWQATSDATLQAVPNNGDKPPFKSVGQGHAVALQSDHAAENAAADALKQAVDDFNVVARKEGN